VAGRGIAQLINAGQIVTFDHPHFEFLGTGHFLGLPFPIILVVITFALVQLLMRRTALGLYVESVGANASASHYLGINDRAIKLMVYCISGLCAALAVVIGGAALMGGRFSIIMSLVGVLIIQTLTTTIIMSGIPPKYNLVIKALAIILVLLFQSPRFQQQLGRLFSVKRPAGGNNA